jgi:predicted MPP superfamily phosphohydrolase
MIVFSLDLYYQSAKRIRIRRETLSSEKIDTDLDGIRIVFFSDLDYGEFMDETRLELVKTKIEDADPDILIFGGDLFSDGVTPDQTMIDTLSTFLSDIDAPLGKFAVYGDIDHSSEEVLNAVNAVYAAANVEVLNNAVVTLHNRTSKSISLIGLDSGLNGTVDVSTPYSQVSRNTYVLTVCHTPDTAADVPEDLTDYFLAGHSHGGQLYYGLGAMYNPEMAQRYFRGKNTVNNSFVVDITNGVGTRKLDMRFGAPAEVVVYTLSSLQAEETSDAAVETEKAAETASPASTASASAEQ